MFFNTVKRSGMMFGQEHCPVYQIEILYLIVPHMASIKLALLLHRAFLFLQNVNNHEMVI